MSPLLRWRVDCRRQRGVWRTVLTEAYATEAEARVAQALHEATGEWDIVAVVEVVGEQGEGRRLLAAGARVRGRKDEG